MAKAKKAATAKPKVTRQRRAKSGIGFRKALSAEVARLAKKMGTKEDVEAIQAEADALELAINATQDKRTRKALDRRLKVVLANDKGEDFSSMLDALRAVEVAMLKFPKAYGIRQPRKPKKK